MNDYRTKLSADTSQHDAALKKSAAQVYQYKKGVEQTKAKITELTKRGFGALLPAIGLAGGAMAAFGKLIKSTEQGTDSFERSMFTLKNSVDRFFQSIATGNLKGFITDLGDILEISREVYDVLDNLGTAKMWKNARIAQYQSQIEGLRTDSQVNPANAAKNLEAIKKLQDSIDRLTNSLTEETSHGADAVIRKITGLRLRSGDIEKLMQMWEGGTLDDYMLQYQKKHSRNESYDYIVGGQLYTGTKRIWDSQQSQSFYNGLQRLYTASEDELKQYYDLLSEAATREGERARKERRNMSGSTSAGGGGKKDSDVWSESDWLKRMTGHVEFTHENNGIIGDVMLGDLTASDAANLFDMASVGFKTIDEGAERAARAAHEAAAEMRKMVETLENGSTVLGSFASGLKSLGGAFDNSTLDIMGILGESVATMLKAYAVATAESAKMGPWAWAAFAATGFAEVSALIASMKSIGKFADGGIVNGRTTIGDRNLALVNKGEMILNEREQTRLWNILNGAVGAHGGVEPGSVTFRISGSDLVGTLDNYSRKSGRVR